MRKDIPKSEIPLSHLSILCDMLEVSSGLVKSVIFDRQTVLENIHPHPHTQQQTN